MDQPKLELKADDYKALQALITDFSERMMEAAADLGTDGRTIEQVSVFLSPLTDLRAAFERIKIRQNGTT